MLVNHTTPSIKKYRYFVFSYKWLEALRLISLNEKNGMKHCGSLVISLNEKAFYSCSHVNEKDTTISCEFLATIQNVNEFCMVMRKIQY